MSLYIKYDNDITADVSDDCKIVIIRKIINRKVYKIEKKLNTNTIGYLAKILEKAKDIPDEFWRPI